VLFHVLRHTDLPSDKWVRTVYLPEAYHSHLNRRVHNPATLVPNIRHLHPALTALHARIYLVGHVTATFTAVSQAVLYLTARATRWAGKRMWWTVSNWSQSRFPAVRCVDLPTYYVATCARRRKKPWKWVEDLATTEPWYRSRMVTGIRSGEPRNRGSVPATVWDLSRLLSILGGFRAQPAPCSNSTGTLFDRGVKPIVAPT